MITLIWLVILLLVLVQYLRRVYSKFSSCGVNTLKYVPLLGNAYPVLTRQRHISEDGDLLYQAFPQDRFVGKYDVLLPVVVLRDLNLIKKVTVKDFEDFLDHKTIVDGTVDQLFGRNLFSLRGQEWKDMRSTLSPAFTSSKMRGMVPFMLEANSSMINVLRKKIEASGKGQVDVECKDLTTRYANDVIASCAFGLKVDSHVDEDNEFYQKGRDTANFGFSRIFVFLACSSFPKLMKKLDVKLFSDETINFFKSLVLNTMKDRDIHKILRPDMIHLLMEAKKVWSDIDLVAQATLFFVAGFETISSAMSFLLHELAVNPDVQDKLVNEISEHETKTGGKFDFNSIQSLKYMDMVVSELLRLWPPAVALDRICIKDYNLGKPNDKAKEDYILRKGDSVIVPTWSLHHDPKYFPNPYKFDPERFSDENKDKIVPFSYLPFGSGPRNCIGSRFALCEIKVMLYELLQNFELTVCEKTTIPAKLVKNTFSLRIDGGHWVRMKLRK